MITKATKVVEGNIDDDCDNIIDMSTLTCECTLVGTGPISFGKPIASVKKTGVDHDAHEKNTWRERLHVDEDGNVFIPPIALKNCLSDVAQYLSEAVPGKGSAKFTKHFKAGIMVTEPLAIYGPDNNPVKAADVIGEDVFVPADGRRGGGKRVWKTFPVIPEWYAHAKLMAIDPTLTSKPKKIHAYLLHAGRFIGLGRFRPINNGFYGRFTVEDFGSVMTLSEV